MALIHILLSGMVPSAYMYLLSVTRQVTEDLSPALNKSPQTSTILGRIGKPIWWHLVLACLFGVLINVYATVLTTPDSNPWNWQQQNFDTKWMRILSPVFCGWIACLFYVLVIESSRLLSLSKTIVTIDLLDLRPYQPLVRQGLTNALLVIGIASIVTLFLLEPGFGSLLIQLSVIFSIFGWIGLMLPLSGIRGKIQQAKRTELDWCDKALITARDALKSNNDHKPSIAEITAYKILIENIRNWPFDNPTLTRFALFLLIPFASMFSSAFVENLLDSFLQP